MSSQAPIVKVAGYARYSTDLQDKGISIESQDSEMRETCRRKGWVFVETYADRGISGSAPVEARPELARLLEDGRQEKFQRVMAFDASRLARDQVIFWMIVGKFRESRIPFCTAIMPDIDSTTPEFEIVAGSLQGAASYERRLTSKKVAIGMRLLKAQGKQMGRPPCGYRIREEDGKVELDEEGLKVVEILKKDPFITAAQVKEMMGILVYKHAWTLLESVKARYRKDGPAEPQGAGPRASESHSA